MKQEIDKQTPLEAKVTKYFREHRDTIKLFFILFAVNLLIYGQKIFFYTLPSDDYMRFHGDDNTKMLITNSARWGQALLNDYIFSGKLQILPYLHGIVGIFCFTLMGFLTARYFARKNVWDTVLITLLISATPMLAHNLYFSTNITTWLTLLFGLIGFLILQNESSGWMEKTAGFFLLIFSIANYQTIIQILTLMILFRVIIRLMEAESFDEIKKIVAKAIFRVVILFAAYLVSYGINLLFLHYHHWSATHRLAKVNTGGGAGVYIARLKEVYSELGALNHFQKPFHLLYLVMAALGMVAVLWRWALSNRPWKIKILLLFLLVAAFASIPIVINLPILLGVDIPTRAYFAIGWAMAGFYLLQRLFLKPVLYPVTVLLSSALVLLSIYYITLFFDANIRQTEADIRRANMIVQRIRMDQNYQHEPIGLQIVGQQAFNVDGWRMKWQQPFNSYWAKYKIFRYFTDLKFHRMDHKGMREMQEYIMTHYEKIEPYPGKNSVIVHHGNATVFLSSDKINIALQKKKNLRHFPEGEKPDIHATFDLYIRDNLLFYEKKQCTKEDVQKRFFLRLYPKDKHHPVINGVRVLPFQTWDFRFPLYGEIKNGRCVAAVKLPDYPLEKIRTGQFGKRKLDWDAYYSFGK